MNLNRAKSFVAALACLAAFFCTPAAYAEVSEKESVLRACNQLFGAPTGTKPHLFEATQFYVLRVEFDSRDRLEQLAVEPKYYFEESRPEWKRPDNFTPLSQVEYDNLLAHLDTIKPKGLLTKPDTGGGVVTNMTSWHKAIYEDAVLEWGEVVDLRRGENALLAIKWIRVNYLKSKSHEPGG